jgi:hypothetical protein
MISQFSSEELAVMLMEFLSTMDSTPVPSILAALTTVTASLAYEAGYDEDASVTAFRNCFQAARDQQISMKGGLN